MLVDTIFFSALFSFSLGGGSRVMVKGGSELKEKFVMENYV